MKETDKIFGVFPDGFRMSYKALLDTLLTSDACEVRSPEMKKLVEEHGGDPKMYFSEGGIEA